MAQHLDRDRVEEQIELRGLAARDRQAAGVRLIRDLDQRMLLPLAARLQPDRAQLARHGKLEAIVRRLALRPARFVACRCRGGIPRLEKLELAAVTREARREASAIAPLAVHELAVGRAESGVLQLTGRRLEV